MRGCTTGTAASAAEGALLDPSGAAWQSCGGARLEADSVLASTGGGKAVVGGRGGILAGRGGTGGGLSAASGGDLTGTGGGGGAGGGDTDAGTVVAGDEHGVSPDVKIVDRLETILAVVPA